MLVNGNEVGFISQFNFDNTALKIEVMSEC